MERDRQSEGHAPTEDGRERFVRTRKETDRARSTHVLETADEGTCQETKRNRTSEGHSLPGDGRAMDLSGREKKPTERGALTNWRWQRERLVRTSKESNQRGSLTSYRWRREILVRT
jgi:hypothetical protein